MRKLTLGELFAMDAAVQPQDVRAPEVEPDEDIRIAQRLRLGNRHIPKSVPHSDPKASPKSKASAKKASKPPVAKKPSGKAVLKKPSGKK